MTNNLKATFKLNAAIPEDFWAFNFQFPFSFEQAVREAVQYAPPLYAARCSPASAHTRLTPAAPSAMNIHDRQASAGSVRWHRLWCHLYKLCSDLSSQPNGLVTLTVDLLTFKVVTNSRVRWAAWAASVLISIFCSRVTPDVRDWQTDVRQTYVRRQIKASLNASPIRGGDVAKSSLTQQWCNLL